MSGGGEKGEGSSRGSSSSSSRGGEEKVGGYRGREGQESE